MNSYFDTETNRKWQNAFNSQTQITPMIRSHLKNVYACLASSVLACAGGVYVNIISNFYLPAIVTIISLFGILYGIRTLSATKENQNLRFALMLAFGFLNGLSLSPIVRMALFIDQSLILHATVATALIFVSFSAIAIQAERRSYLYLGAVLASGLSVMMWSSLFNMFVKSSTIWNIELYMGLLIFMGYVIFDTQLIIEKAAGGSRDFIGHSIELFSDLLAIFVRIIIIMMKNNRSTEDKKKRK